MAQTTGDNNYGVAKWIVDATLGNGTHQTIAAALTSASSGDTIFIRPGTYTENPTLKAGVNLTAFTCDANTPNVTIAGKCTLSTVGTVSISGINFQTNSDFCIAVTGSVASILNVIACNINATNNTAISYTSSNASSQVNLILCTGNLGTTGIGLFAHSSSGNLVINDSFFTNTGASTTVSSCSSGIFNSSWSEFNFPLSMTSTSGTTWEHVSIYTSAQNVISATLNGTTHSCKYCVFSSGTASGATIGSANCIFDYCVVASSHASTAVTGSGTIKYSAIAFDSTQSVIDTTTTVQENIAIGTVKYGLWNGTIITAGFGGTGIGSWTDHSALLCTGTSNTGNFQDITSVATGQVLISQGTSTLPVWSANPSISSIIFPAFAGNAGTATTDTLVGYEEGTFTGTIIGGSVAGTTTYTAQTGYYTRIGNMVTVWFTISFSAATGTGNMVIGGFPYTIKNQSNFSPIGGCTVTGPSVAWPASDTYLIIQGTANTKTAFVVGNKTSGANAIVQMANQNFQISGTLNYQV